MAPDSQFYGTWKTPLFPPCGMKRVFPGQILSIVLVRYYVLVRFPRDADEQKKRTTLHSVEVHPPCQLGNKKASVKQNRKFDADD